MTIAIVGTYPLSPDCIRGGVESSVFGLANVLCKDDIVDVFDTPRIGGIDTGERHGNLTIHRYCNRGRYNQDAIHRANEVLRDIVAIHPDLVHIHGTGEFSSYVLRAIKSYGIKVLLTVHGLLHIEKRNLLKKHFSIKHLYQYIRQSRSEFAILNEAGHVIVDTEYVANKIKTYHQAGKICHIPYMYVIPQGIDEAYLLSTPPRDSHTILSVGTISRRKGHLFLLKAFDQVATKNPSAQLVIAGVLAEKDYYAVLLRYVASSPNKDRISIRVDLPQHELLDLYSHAVIFALHSQEESQGIALVEAMGAHLPIVATQVGGIPFVVKDNETGLLSEYTDIDTFANNLQELLSNTAKRQFMAETAYMEAQKYTWKQIADAIRALFNQL